MSDPVHVPAAFINAIAEEGTKAEAIAFLQKQWNEYWAMRAERDSLALQVLTLTNERDEARALGRLA